MKLFIYGIISLIGLSNSHLIHAARHVDFGISLKDLNTQLAKITAGLLGEAAATNNVEKVKELISKSKTTDINQAFRWIDKNNIEMADLFLKYGADPNQVFAFFVSEGSPELIDLLIKSGADVNRFDNEGSVPLNKAFFRWKFLEKNKSDKKGPVIVQKLLAAGADINKKDKYERTPLSVLLSNPATLQRDNVPKELFEILIKAGAIVPEEALNIVTFSGRPDIIQILEDAAKSQRESHVTTEEKKAIGAAVTAADSSSRSSSSISTAT